MIKSKKLFRIKKVLFSCLIGSCILLPIVATTTLFATKQSNNSNISLNNNIQNSSNYSLDAKSTNLYSSSDTSIKSYFQLNGLDKSYYDQISPTQSNKNEFDYYYSKIYPSQHFGTNWLGVNSSGQYSYDNQTTQSTFIDQIKQLIIDNSKSSSPNNNIINNLPSDFTIKNIQIVGEGTPNPNFYIDNATGSIVVCIKINYYYQNNQLIGNATNVDFTNALEQRIQISGFKKVSSPTFFNTVLSTNGNLVGYNQTINITNIDSFAGDTNNYKYLVNTYLSNLQNGINCDLQPDKNTTSTLLNQPISSFPGPGILKSNFSFKNFFKTQYVNEKFEISDTQTPDSTPICSFIFDTNPQFEVSFNVNNSQYNQDNIKFTYVNESTYEAPANFRNSYASLLTDVTQINNLLNSLLLNNPNIIVNPVNNTTKIVFDNTLGNPTFNDITGELFLNVKLVGDIYVNNQISTSSNNTYKIIINNFTTRLPTSIASVIDIKNNAFINNEFKNKYPDNICNVKNATPNKNPLKTILLDATLNNLGFSSLPIDTNNNISTYLNQNCEFVEWKSPENNESYYGKPNNIEGNIELTIRLKKYYSPSNGGLVDATNNVDNQLILKTKIINCNSNKTSGIFVNDGFIKQILYNNQNELATNAINNMANLTDFIKNPNNFVLFKYDVNGLIVQPTEDLSNVNIKINPDQATNSLNDHLTSNLNGTLNLHYSISGGNGPTIYSSINGLPLINNNRGGGNVTTLINGFLKVNPTVLNENVNLDIPLYVCDLAYDINQADDSLLNSFQDQFYKQILERVEQTVNGQILKYTKDLFKNEICIPKDILDIIKNPSRATELNRFIVNPYIIDESLTPGENILNKYSKEGYLPVSISLNQYYDINGKLKIVSQQDPSIKPLQSTINFNNFIIPKPTTVNFQINANEPTKYASDYQDETTLKEFLINRQKSNQDVFQNVPNLFLKAKNSFNVRVIKVNNEYGTLDAEITLNKYYFDNNCDFVENNKPSNTFKIQITGFNQVKYATTINNYISIKDLYVDGKNLSNYSDLCYYLSKTSSAGVIDDYTYDNSINVDPSKSDTANKDFPSFDLTTIIEQNLNVFFNNPYVPNNVDPNIKYIEINNNAPIIPNFNNGTFEFTIKLNYYYGNDNNGNINVPIIAGQVTNGQANNIPPLTGTIKIGGFDQIIGQTSFDLSAIDVQQIPSDSTLAIFKNYSIDQFCDPQNKTKIFDAFKQSLVNKENITYNNFSNLPIIFNPNYDVIELSQITNNQATGAAEVTFNFKNIYSSGNNGTICVGNNVPITINFTNFKSNVKPVIQSKFDLAEITTQIDVSNLYSLTTSTPNDDYYFHVQNWNPQNSQYPSRVSIDDILNSPKNLFSLQLPLWNLFKKEFVEIIKAIIYSASKNQNLFIENIPNLTFDQITIDPANAIINATNGTISNLSITVPNVGTQTVEIKGFATYSPTRIKNNRVDIDKTSIQLLTSNQSFFPSQWYENNKNNIQTSMNDLFSNALNAQYQQEANQNINLFINNLFFTNDNPNNINNTIKNLLNTEQQQAINNNLNNPELKNNLELKITSTAYSSFDDKNGSINFKFSLSNYFDDKGIWVCNATQPYTFNQEISLIFLNSIAQEFDLQKTDADVDSIGNFILNINKFSNELPNDIAAIFLKIKELVYPYLNNTYFASDFFNNVLNNDTSLNLFNQFFTYIATMAVDFNQVEPIKISSVGQTKWITVNQPLYAYTTNNVNQAFINSASTSGLIGKNNIIFNTDYKIIKNSNVIVDDEKGTITFKNVSFNNKLTFIKNTASLQSGATNNGPINLVISGFKKNTEETDLVVIISVVVASVGFIIILALLIWFIIRKVRSY